MEIVFNKTNLFEDGFVYATDSGARLDGGYILYSRSEGKHRAMLLGQDGKLTTFTKTCEDRDFSGMALRKYRIAKIELEEVS